MLQAFRRLAFSSLVFRLADGARFDAVKAAIEADPRLTLDVKREQRFYAEQSEQLSSFISYLGTTLSIIFSIGAMIGAMITMYAASPTRTAEIGTLRALGFPRSGDPAWRSWPRRCCSGSPAASSGCRGRVAHAGAVDLDDQLPDLRRARVQLHADADDRAASLAFALAMGFVGGFLPGGARGAA